MKASTAHPTADAIYAEAKKAIPKLSLATVYRNLSMLDQAGMLQKLHVPGGADHYDATMTKHYHLFCEKCGRVYDIRMDIDDAISEAEKSSGHKITEANIHFKGICSECLKKEASGREQNHQNH